MSYSKMKQLLNDVLPDDVEIREMINVPECLNFLEFCEDNHKSGDQVEVGSFFGESQQFHLMFISLGIYAEDCFTFKYYIYLDEHQTELTKQQVFHMFSDHPELLDEITVEVFYK